MKEENLWYPNSIRTFTGEYVNVFDPDPKTIKIEDIAHSLSNICRFGGHLPKFYSVAQHNVLVSDRVSPELKLQGLMHDASEAYLLDIPSPIKAGLTNYKQLESNMMSIINGIWNFGYPLGIAVKKADRLLLEWEWSTLMLNENKYSGIECWSPAEAEKIFMKTFIEIHERL